MTRSELATSCFSAIQARNTAAARGLLAPDFHFIGGTPEPISADAWLGVHGGLSEGFSDFSFNVSNVVEAGDVVTLNVAISGTHNGTITLPLPGMPPIPATGKKVQLPKEDVTVRFAGEKIASVVVVHREDGGLPSVLRQVGVEMPR